MEMQLEPGSSDSNEFFFKTKWLKPHCLNVRIKQQKYRKRSNLVSFYYYELKSDIKRVNIFNINILNNFALSKN